jgi:hypothetical protein
MAILQVSSRQFREKQKTFLELEDKGEQVVIKRRSKQAYLLTPINDDDLFFTPDFLLRSGILVINPEIKTPC